MKYDHAHWGWMLAADFFLGGTGGGLLVVTGVLDVVLSRPVPPFAVGLVAALLIGSGSGLLLLELGRPLQGWRVFINPRAILTIGAWMMLLALACAAAYASFGLPFLPWSGIVPLRWASAVGGIIFGLGISTYTGVLLGRMKGRGLWSGPGVAVLFVLSALSTGMAALILIALATGGAAPMAESGVLASLLALQALLWPLYLYVKTSAGTVYEVAPARRWLMGDRALLFWVGIWVVGLVAPLMLSFAGGPIASPAAALAVLMGGIVMR
jgi:protein NrfD